MRHIQQSDQRYTDLESFAVMTRTKVLTDVQLSTIADHLRSGSEDGVSCTNPIDLDDRRLVQTILGWSYRLAPMHIGANFDL
jgi:hypothetical protein